MMYYYQPFHFPWFPLLLLLVLLVILLNRGSRRNRWGRWDRTIRQSSAEDILSERFAKGEISEQEYRERMDALRRQEQ
jgi:uncharacterized membrane protein